VATALRVFEGARRVAQSTAYRDGLIEVQDAASQACVLATPVPAEGTILDYCAGGGGKALALAARASRSVMVHDISARRMQDIPARAARAGVDLPIWQGNPQDQFDLVFCDAPCSGSGTWRRAPGAKWALTEAALADYCTAQRAVITAAVPLVREGGALVYATCSLLREENADQVSWILDRFPEFLLETQVQSIPGDPGDGFFYAVFRQQGASGSTNG
jgi:16S rRNA (cytosine967-C5)-methyltransferase